MNTTIGDLVLTVFHYVGAIKVGTVVGYFVIILTVFCLIRFVTYLSSR